VFELLRSMQSNGVCDMNLNGTGKGENAKEVLILFMRFLLCSCVFHTMKLFTELLSNWLYIRMYGSSKWSILEV
jgi:hypothetical protein